MHSLPTPPALIRPAFALLAVFLCSCGERRPPDRAWDMLAVGLPAEATPRVAMLNMGYYLLRQTHRPLFDLQSDGRFSSRLLERWTRAIDSTSYVLCPAGGLRFDASRPFDRDYLARFLRARATTLDPRAAISEEGACVRVALTRNGDRFLPFFADMANAPTVTTPDPKVELGLGDFRAETVSSDRIVLSRKETVTDGYEKVVMHAHGGANDPRLEDRGVEDMNRVLLQDLPDWVKTSYDDYGVTLLQSVNLLIDAPDPATRRLVHGCLDVDRFRRAFMPRQRDFADIATILPLGLPGARAERPSQRCPSTKVRAGAPALTFGNWNRGNEEGLRAEFIRLSAATGLRFDVKTLSQDDFVKQILSTRRTFDLSVIALDATSPDYAAFYGPVVGDRGRFARVALPQARALLDLLSGEADAKRLSRDVAELDALLAGEGLVLPLYQETRTFYYPKGLKGLELGNNFLEYPDIGQIRF